MYVSGFADENRGQDLNREALSENKMTVESDHMKQRNVADELNI